MNIPNGGGGGSQAAAPKGTVPTAGQLPQTPPMRRLSTNGAAPNDPRLASHRLSRAPTSTNPASSVSKSPLASKPATPSQTPTVLQQPSRASVINTVNGTKNGSTNSPIGSRLGGKHQQQQQQQQRAPPSQQQQQPSNIQKQQQQSQPSQQPPPQQQRPAAAPTQTPPPAPRSQSQSSNSLSSHSKSTAMQHPQQQQQQQPSANKPIQLNRRTSLGHPNNNNNNNNNGSTNRPTDLESRSGISPVLFPKEFREEAAAAAAAARKDERGQTNKDDGHHSRIAKSQDQPAAKTATTASAQNVPIAASNINGSSASPIVSSSQQQQQQQQQQPKQQQHPLSASQPVGSQGQPRHPSVKMKSRPKNRFLNNNNGGSDGTSETSQPNTGNKSQLASASQDVPVQSKVCSSTATTTTTTTSGKPPSGSDETLPVINGNNHPHRPSSKQSLSTDKTLIKDAESHTNNKSSSQAKLEPSVAHTASTPPTETESPLVPECVIDEVNPNSRSSPEKLSPRRKYSEHILEAVGLQAAPKIKPKLESTNSETNKQILSETKHDRQSEINNATTTPTRTSVVRTAPVVAESPAVVKRTSDKTSKVQNNLAQLPLKPFSWDAYLNLKPAEVAPKEAFNQSTNLKQSKFFAGVKLEARDPRSDSWCLATVIYAEGPRIKLRFDGTDTSNDFWELIDSNRIRAVGARPGMPLFPPIGFTQDLSRYQSFVDKTLSGPGVKIASPEWFSTTPKPPATNLFKKGMKLEAVDRKQPYLICPATIESVSGSEVAIKFDGWNSKFSYKCKFSDRDLFPINWCRENNYNLNVPQGWDIIPDPKPEQTKPVKSPATKERPPVPSLGARDRVPSTAKLSVTPKKLGRTPKLYKTPITTAQSFPKPARVKTEKRREPKKTSPKPPRPESGPESEEAGDSTTDEDDLPMTSGDARYQCQRAVPYDQWRKTKLHGKKSSDGEEPAVFLKSPENPPPCATSTSTTGENSSISSCTIIDLTEANFEPSSGQKIDSPTFRRIRVDTIPESSHKIEPPPPKRIRSEVKAGETPTRNEPTSDKIESPGYEGAKSGVGLGELAPQRADSSTRMIIGAESTPVDPAAQKTTNLPNRVKAGAESLQKEPRNGIRSSNASKPSSQWTVRDVLDLIGEDESLKKYSEVFENNEIDGRAFLLLTTDIMINQMGLKLGPVLKLNNLIEQAKRLER